MRQLSDINIFSDDEVKIFLFHGSFKNIPYHFARHFAVIANINYTLIVAAAVKRW